MPGFPWGLAAGFGQGFNDVQQYNTNAINNQIALMQMRQFMAQQQAQIAFSNAVRNYDPGAGQGLPTGIAPAPQPAPPAPTPMLGAPQPPMMPQPGMPGMQPGGQPGGQSFMPPSPLQTAGLPNAGVPMQGAAPPPSPPQMNPALYPPQSPLPPIAGAGPAAGLDVPVPPSLAPIYQRESGGNYRIQNPTSTASGAGQDIDSTWREAMRGLGYKAQQWAHAKDAPPGVQNAANIWLQAKYGNKPWAASEPGGAAARPGATALAQARARGAGPPPPGAEDAALAIDNTAPQIDPSRMGMMALHELAMEIEQANPGAPPLVKAMALQMGMQYLAPEQRMAWQELKQHQHENFQMQKQYQHEDFLAKQAVEAREGKGWQFIESGGKVYRANPNTGEMEPADLAPGAHKLGTNTARSMPAMVMQKYMEENPNASSEELSKFAANYRYNQAIETSLGSGQNGQQMVRLNTLSSHILLVKQYAEELKNGNLQRANMVANKISAETGGPEVTTFEAGRTIMADEIVRMLTSTGGTEEDRKNMQAIIDSRLSPAQFAGVFGVFTDFVGPRFQAVRQMYAQGDKAREEEFDQKFLSPEAKQVFASFRSGAGSTKPAEQPAAAPAKPAGQPAAAPAKPRMTAAPPLRKGEKPPGGESPVIIDNDDDFDHLPQNAVYQGPDGIPRRKP